MNDLSSLALLLIPASFIYVVGSLIVEGRKLDKETGRALSLDTVKGEWSGHESIYDVTRHGRGALYLIPVMIGPFGLSLSLSFLLAGEGLIMPVIIGGLSIFGMKKAIDWGKSPVWLRDEWRLAASVDGLAYSKAGAPFWSIRWDDVARVESGATVEWEKMRKYGGGGSASIPDAEYQTFIFTSDGRRLVVHTANAAREDCGRLAHSIRSYVETQRGNAAPVDGASNPAADGFDL